MLMLKQRRRVKRLAISEMLCLWLMYSGNAAILPPLPSTFFVTINVSVMKNREPQPENADNGRAVQG
jgi:hypothetical protein